VNGTSIVLGRDSSHHMRERSRPVQLELLFETLI